METEINMVDYANKIFKTIRAVTITEKITDDTCSNCLVLMEEIDNTGYFKPGPDRDCEPDYIKTSITYRCPECGEKTTVYNQL